MESEQVFRLEVLISDLIRLTARNQAKLLMYEEEINRMQQQITVLENYAISLMKEENKI